MTLIAEIERHVRRAYGSASNPDFSFVRRAQEQNPYAAMLRELPATCTVLDDTDTNDDVSFNYLITCSKQTWRLALSMVGPFAMLVRASRSAPHAEVIDPQDVGVSPAEADILTLLRRHAVTALNADDIRHVLDRGHAAAGNPAPTVYELLFTDSEALPTA